MGNVRDEYGLTEEDKKRLEEVRRKQEKSRKGMTPEEIEKQSKLKRQEYSGPSVTREDSER